MLSHMVPILQGLAMALHRLPACPHSAAPAYPGWTALPASPHLSLVLIRGLLWCPLTKGPQGIPASPCSKSNLFPQHGIRHPSALLPLSCLLVAEQGVGSASSDHSEKL